MSLFNTRRLSLKQKFFLVLYYAFARWLPCSYQFKLAGKIRYFCCKHIFKKIGKDVNIEHGAYFGTGVDIEIGDRSGIGVHAHIFNNTIIGSNVMIGPNLFMLESNHLFDRLDIPMIDQGRKTEPEQVIIGDDVWIGRDVMIIGSRQVKTGSIIGARCLLTKTFPEYSIVGGNPGKLIRNRQDEKKL